ncbi:MAG TPA: hypothetical protein DHV62_06285 [Elusimicrobia bacterium]|nr:hypothetical protein [Elusimicrobiota bacterium]
MKDYSYESLVESIKLCPLQCGIHRNVIKENEGIKIWLNSNSSHSMDSTFWVITNDSIAKFWTGEMGVLPDWPELDEEELFQGLLAETLNSKQGTQKLKRLLASCKIDDLKYGRDCTIYISQKPLKENPRVVPAVIGSPELNFYTYGFVINNRKKNKTMLNLAGFDIFPIWIYQLIELLAYCYGTTASGNDLEDYKDGYIDVCGNELVYHLNEVPEIALRKLAPKLFKTLYQKLVVIEPDEQITMARENYTVWNDKPLEEVLQYEKNLEKERKKEQRRKRKS